MGGPGSNLGAQERSRLLILGVAAACILLLALPGRTVTAAFINDVFIFLDGAHRIASGQVPNRDFHTALGPLAFYIPATGLTASGNFGAALPVGMALSILAVLPALLWVLCSRLAPLLAAVFGIFLILLLAVPTNLGGPIEGLSFAMFYNRVGWFALALLLVMYLPRNRPSRFGDLADAAAASFLLLVQLYTKATYGVVSACFLAFLLLDRRHRTSTTWAVLMTVFVILVVELLWGGTRQHVKDILDASRVSGGRGLWGVLHSAFRNLADLSVFALAVGCSLWTTRNLRDLLFYAFCALAGLLIISQNAHGWGIITLYAAVAVAAEQAARKDRLAIGDGTGIPPSRLVAGLPFILVFLTFPPAAHHAASLILHSGLAMTNSGTPVGLPLLQDVRALESRGGGARFIGRYLESIKSGGTLLQSLPERPGRVLVLDFSNPFSAGLGLSPPKGDSAWMHWGRNLNAEKHPAPEALFADVNIVMIPKIGINSVPLQEIYRPFIQREFALLKETSEWTLYQRRPMGAAR